MSKKSCTFILIESLKKIDKTYWSFSRSKAISKKESFVQPGRTRPDLRKQTSQLVAMNCPNIPYFF